MQRTWRVAGLLGVATVAIRLPRALGDAFWQDEVASARIIREPTLGGMLGHVARTESTPPLWYFAGWLLHKVGVSVHDVRLLSVVAGAMLVALVVRVAARLLPLPLAAAAGVLTAVGAQFTAHGRELRAYELFALLVLLFAEALRSAVAAPSRGRLAVLGVVTAAGAMTHYFFAFTLAAGLVWLWLEPSARASRRRVTGAVAVALACCSPWLPLFVAQYRHDRYSWIGPFDALETLETPLRIFSPAIATPAAGTAFLAWVVLAAWIAWRRGAGARLLAVLAVAPLALAGATWAAGVDAFAVRNMIGIGPFVAVVALLPLTMLPVRAHLAAAGAVAVAATALFVVAQKPTTPFDAIAAALVHEGWRPSAAVVVQGGFYDFRSPLEWYLPHLPELVRGSRAHLHGRPTFAIVRRRPLPSRLVTRSVRIGGYEVERLRPRAAVHWLPHGVVLASPVRAGVPRRVPAVAW